VYTVSFSVASLRDCNHFELNLLPFYVLFGEQIK